MGDSLGSGRRTLEFTSVFHFLAESSVSDEKISIKSPKQQT
jgi:hypothetical protein